MSNLRVIAGKARGTRLRSVPGDMTRPITNRVKEALFNIIGADIQDAIFMDLFAGTGSVGIEALSRGASKVLFVDANPLPVQIIKENVKKTHLELGADIIRMDAFRLINQPPGQAFDYVYVAPPQYKGLWKAILLKLDQNPVWLSEDAWVICQIHPVEYEAIGFPELVHLQEFDRRVYGSTLLVFYERMEANMGSS